jgi:hypothetical protein
MSTNILCKDEISPLRFIIEGMAVPKCFPYLRTSKIRSLMMIALYYRNM